MSPLVKMKRQANFKDFKGFEAFKGLAEQKNLVFNSWAFKTLVSLAFETGALMAKKAQFIHEHVK
jgi:hypothetical protein